MRVKQRKDERERDALIFFNVFFSILVIVGGESPGKKMRRSKFDLVGQNSRGRKEGKIRLKTFSGWK